MKRGESVSFNYTGAIQTYTIESSGVYLLECWGSKSGSCYSSLGKTRNGGYAKGNIKLKKGTKLYIVCGGIASYINQYATGQHSGGYNGGGQGSCTDYDDPSGKWTYVNGGGGATHIATQSGLLSALGQSDNVIIVAGGGAGGGGARVSDSTTYYYEATAGGDQTARGTAGQGANATSRYDGGSASGGGGWYGGTAGKGGSSYCRSDMFETTLTQGTNNDSGKAKLTLIKKSSIKFGNKECEIYYGNKQISLHYGSKDM